MITGEVAIELPKKKRIVLSPPRGGNGRYGSEQAHTVNEIGGVGYCLETELCDWLRVQIERILQLCLLKGGI
jgi:hypothetical protein